MSHAKTIVFSLAVLALGSCASTDAALLTPDGQLLRNLDPAPFRIGLAAVGMAGVESRSGEMAFAFDAEGLRQQLLNDLRSLRAASEVFAIDDPSTDGASRADLVLRPRVTTARLTHSGTTSGAVLSTLLWLTTWVGGLLIEDSSYQASVQVEWEVVNPMVNATIDEFSASSADTELAFVDRNAFVSLGTMQALVMPPFLTSDDEERAARRLSELAAVRVAARVASYLKSRLDGDERDLLGELRLEQPRNGATVGSSFELRGRIVAREPIQGLLVELNGKRVLAVSGDELPPTAAQRRGSLYQVALTGPGDSAIELEAAPGRNELVLYFNVGGRNTSRTVVVHREQS